MNKQELAYRVIRDRILDGTYGPGYRLVIDALAEELGVSALPVREAIRRLEAESLVVYRPNAGGHVAPADAALWESAMTVLAVLEGYATALTAEHLGSDDIAQHIPYRGWSSIEEHGHLIELLEARAPAEEIERAAREQKLRTVAAFRRRRAEPRLAPVGAAPEPGGS